MSKLSVLWFCAALGVCPSMAQRASADIVTNGSLVGVPGEASDPLGWDGYTTELVLPGGLASTSAPGGIFAYLMPASTDGGTFALGQSGGGLNETLMQHLTGLTPGQTYRVMFEYGNGGYLQGTSSFPDEVGAGYYSVHFGASVQDTGPLTFDGFGSQTWHPASMDFVADASSLDFYFETRFVPGGPVRMAVDGISVAPVPAPGAAALLGLGGLMTARRRRAGVR